MTTCTWMRELMLEAELDELRGVGDSTLAGHVRECAACRAVAGAIVAETCAMAGLLPMLPDHEAASVQRKRTSPSRRWIGAAALPLAAAGLLVLISEPEPSEHRDLPKASTAALDGPATEIAAETASAAPVANVEITPPPSSAQAVDGPAAIPDSPGPGDSRPVATVASAEPRESTAFPPGLRGGSELRLTPTPGTRTLVMQTRDPAVTVVWIY